jgi:hypothetical protein
MNDCDYDCSSSDLSSNFTAVREYIYYIVPYLWRCSNKWYFCGGGGGANICVCVCVGGGGRVGLGT